jgi:hypothetical protein
MLPPVGGEFPIGAANTPERNSRSSDSTRIRSPVRSHSGPGRRGHQSVDIVRLENCREHAAHVTPPSVSDTAHDSAAAIDTNGDSPGRGPRPCSVPACARQGPHGCDDRCSSVGNQGPSSLDQRSSRTACGPSIRAGSVPISRSTKRKRERRERNQDHLARAAAMHAKGRPCGQRNGDSGTVFGCD